MKGKRYPAFCAGIPTYEINVRLERSISCIKLIFDFVVSKLLSQLMYSLFAYYREITT